MSRHQAHILLADSLVGGGWSSLSALLRVPKLGRVNFGTLWDDPIGFSTNLGTAGGIVPGCNISRCLTWSA